METIVTQPKPSAQPPRRAIPSRPGYLASEDGHIYSAERGRLAERPTHDGYLRVRLWNGKRHDHIAVAVLVAEAYRGTRPGGMQVRHLNGDRQDNRAENLTYGTAKQNADDRERHQRTARGIRAANARHTFDEVQAAVAQVEAGCTQYEVAAAFGVSQSTVWRWVHRTQRAVA